MTRTKVRVKDVMTGDVVSIGPQDSLREALTILVENRVSVLPVIDARNHCVGVLSVTDLLSMTKDLADELNALSEIGGLDHEALVQKLEHADLVTEQVKDWMSSNVVSVGLEGTIRDAARQMRRNRVHRLVVINDDGRVVGVVSTMDLLSAVADESRA